MEQFLAEHQVDQSVDPEEVFEEQDVAEALAGPGKSVARKWSS